MNSKGIPQCKLNQKIIFDCEFTTAKYAGEMIAKFCHGLLNWQGVREFEGKSGLKHAADIWLKKNNISSGKAIVLEYAYGDGTSRYVAGWKQ